MTKITSYPKVSIVIPTRNRLTSLSKTLSSLSGLDYPKSKIEIIIVDNGSTDGTFELIKNGKPGGFSGKIKLVRNKTNRGFAPALNQAIYLSQSDYILITNDDVIFDPPCLNELVALSESDPTVGITTGKMFFRNLSAQAGTKRMAFSGFKVNLWLGYQPYDEKGKNTIRDIDVATGGCMLIKRSVLKKVGLFDEKYFFCGEDYDFSFRVRYSGFKVLYNPKAVLWHGFLGSGKNSPDSLINHYYGKFRFVLTHSTFPQLFFFFPFQVFANPNNLKYMFTAASKILGSYKEILKTRRKIQKLKKNEN